MLCLPVDFCGLGSRDIITPAKTIWPEAASQRTGGHVPCPRNHPITATLSVLRTCSDWFDDLRSAAAEQVKSLAIGRALAEKRDLRLNVHYEEGLCLWLIPCKM